MAMRAIEECNGCYELSGTHDLFSPSLTMPKASSGTIGIYKRLVKGFMSMPYCFYEFYL